MPTDDPIAHCVLFSDLSRVKIGDPIEVAGQEAHHAARVKRVRPGERIGLLDGEGHHASGTLQSVGGSRSNPVLDIRVDHWEQTAPISPVVEVAAALPKGDRLDRMIDLLAQIGVTRYCPLICDRSQRRAETVRPDKLMRISDEAMKQCRRPWRMEIGEPIAFESAIQDPAAVVADASGPVWCGAADFSSRTLILVGPEGGWSNAERQVFVDTQARVRRFGLFVLRIEAAAAAASAMVICSNPESGS